MVDLFRNQKWDLVTKRGLYYVISGLMLIICVIALATKGLNYGIDFTGGGLVTYSVEGKLPDSQRVIKEVREKLSGIQGSEVQVSPGAVAGSGDQIIVRTMFSEDENANHDAELAVQIKDTITPAVTGVVKDQLPNAPAPVLESQDVVTGTVSGELVRNGATALVLGSILIMLWIGLRYNINGAGFRYSAGGILALLHDLMILVGMFAIMREVFQVNSPFIAALLTVLGYSIHDTIVIYDRIRENIHLRKGRTFAETVNISLLETMARSVNTVLTVLFTLLALIFFGGPTLRDFTAAMLIGIVVGAYSSIFLASQLLVTWAKGKDRVILPPGETVTPATVAVAAPQPAMAGSVPTSIIPEVAAPPREALQQARQAGRTSKRRR